MASCFRVSGDSILLAVKVSPGASRSRVAGLGNDRLRISVAAAAEDGRANAELRSFLAKALSCPRTDIALVAGEQSRLKPLSLPLSCLEPLQTLLPPEETECSVLFE
jgi:uncharacterized protein (TIGR00251 family)